MLEKSENARLESVSSMAIPANTRSKDMLSAFALTVLFSALPLAPAQAQSAIPNIRSLIPDSSSGTIKSVDMKAKSFVVTVQGKDVSFKFDDKTTYRLDGNASTRDRVLVAGKKATVTYSGSMASEVAATSA